MSDSKIIRRQADGIGWLVFNNPERHNAVSLEMWTEAADTIDAFVADESVRVIVVRGAGGRAFVSGADISKFESERAAEDAVAVYDRATERAYETLLASPKPSIAMIEGYCIGGGVNLAVCCDLRICGEGASFAVPAAKLGLGYGYTRIRRLMNVVSAPDARDIFFTARRLKAAEAYAMRLVNRVVPDAELEAVATETAKLIAGNAPLTVGAIKRTITEALKPESDRDLALCDALARACFESEDYAEGRLAFREKRAPAFKGR